MESSCSDWDTTGVDSDWSVMSPGVGPKLCLPAVPPPSVHPSQLSRRDTTEVGVDMDVATEPEPEEHQGVAARSHPRIRLPESPTKTITSWGQVDRVRGAESNDELVFQVVGKYPSIRRELAGLGFVENKDWASPIFHFMWAFKEKQIPFKKLDPFQVVNHLGRIGELTTKIGLSRNMRAIKILDGVDVERFFPVCFDLTVPEGVSDFLDEYAYVAAESAVKKAAAGGKVNRAVVEAAIQLCLERHFPSPDPPTQDRAKPTRAESKKRTKYLYQDSASENEKPAKPQPTPPTFYETLLQAFRDVLSSGSSKVTASLDPEDELRQRSQDVCGRVGEVWPQFGLNGKKNAWIVKNARLSRGRGIEIMTNVEKMMTHCRAGKFDYIVQKYIENPMLISGRKFDIRQWALLVDVDPLTVYIYDDCYLRLATNRFSMKDMGDKYTHLCNRSVQKASDKYTDSDMWSQETFREYLRDNYGESCADPWAEKVKEGMKKIILATTKSIVGLVDPRKGCFELLGYDFMVDENLNPWLIEVNSSPDMGSSNPVLGAMVPDMVRDTIGIVLSKNKSLLASAGHSLDLSAVPARPHLGKWELGCKTKMSQERLQKRSFMKQRLKTESRGHATQANLREIIHDKIIVAPGTSGDRMPPRHRRTKSGSESKRPVGPGANRRQSVASFR